MQFFRDLAKGWFGKILFGFIICMFVLWGAESLLVMTKSKNRPAAKVNGEAISKEELENNTVRQREVIERQFQGRADPSLIDPIKLKKDVLDAMIERLLLRQFAHNKEMSASKVAIDKWVSSMPQFQQDGRFSQSLFERSIKQIGLTPRDFFSELSHDYVLNQLRQSVVDSEFITDFDLKFVFELEKQSRNISFAKLPKSDFLEAEKISDEAISHYFQKEKERFKREEKAKFTYITFKMDDYLSEVNVTPEEIDAEYKKRVLALKNREERKSAHILIEVKKNEPKEVKEKAFEKAKAIYAEVSVGGDFSALAKKYSEDLGSVESGGDLGYASKGMFEEAYEKVLFSLKKGEISQIVESDYGFHIIKLLEIKETEPPSFQSEKDAILLSLRQQKAEDIYQENIEAIRSTGFESGDLEAVAEKFKKKIEHSDWVSKIDIKEEKEVLYQADLFKDAAVIKAAFSEDVIQSGYNSELVEVNPRLSILLHRAEYQSADYKPLIEVKDEIMAELKKKNAEIKAEELGQKLITSLKMGVSQAEVVKGSKIVWEDREKLLRFGDALPRSILSDIFSAPRPISSTEPSYFGAVSDGDFYVISLKSVNQETDEKSVDDLKQIKKFLARQRGAESFERFVENLRLAANITGL